MEFATGGFSDQRTVLIDQRRGGVFGLGANALEQVLEFIGVHDQGTLLGSQSNVKGKSE